MVLVSIFDQVSNAYTAPLMVPNTAAAVRYVRDIALDNPTYKRHGEDFILRVVGTFDDRTGAIAPCTIQDLCSLKREEEKDAQ